MQTNRQSYPNIETLKKIKIKTILISILTYQTKVEQ